MEESLKTRVIIILAVLSCLLFVVSLSSCASSVRYKEARKKEMSLRFDLEEKMAKSAQEEIESARKADDLKKELDEERAAHQAVKKALVQEQLVNQSLKDELAKITRLKEALEEDLKESLVKNKKAKK